MFLETTDDYKFLNLVQRILCDALRICFAYVVVWFLYEANSLLFLFLFKFLLINFYTEPM